MSGTRQRRWAFFFALIAIVGIILFSAGLRDLELAPGRLLPRGEPVKDLFYLGRLPGSEILLYVVKAIIFLVVLLVPVAIVYVLISPEARKQVLKNLVVLLWLIPLYFLARSRPEIAQQFEAGPPNPLPMGEPAVSTVEFVPNPPQGFVWAVTLAFAALFAAGLVGIAWYGWRRTRHPESPLEQLAQEAETALQALQAGADLKDTVMRCYLEMNRALREQRGIRRQEAMTPREFARSLAKAGLPEEQVQHLTRLFEGVRYGTHAPGEREGRQATDCLTAIVEACRSSR
jgi:hypothetical protein